MIDGHAAYRAPGNVRLFKTTHKTLHIICTASRLPIVELLPVVCKKFCKKKEVMVNSGIEKNKPVREGQKGKKP